MYIDRVTLEDGGDPGVYPFSLPAIRALAARGHLKLHPKCTFLIGENGIGKSTLVEGIAVRWGFNAEGGTKNFNFGTRDSHSGLYILDEPEAALSPSRQLAFLVRLHDLIGESCQFIIATHSPILMAYPDAWIYELTEDGLERVDYENTDHFQLTHRFLNNCEGMLEQLLAEGDEDESGQRRFEG